MSARLLIVFALLFPATAPAHPLEYHLEPLDAASVERVLISFELLITQLQNADSLASANLPDDALGVTALVWSIEDAVAAMDESSPVDSPALLQSLAAAGYESSPYVVAEWKMEAERVLESYEVLSGKFRAADIYGELAELDQNRDKFTEEEIEHRESALIRRMSMLQTTAGDISQVAPYRERLDALTGRLNP